LLLPTRPAVRGRSTHQPDRFGVRVPMQSGNRTYYAVMTPNREPNYSQCAGRRELFFKDPTTHL